MEVVEALMRQAITAEALQRKEDAEAYRAEKREEQEKELRREREKELEKHWNHHHHSSGGDFPRTGSLPLQGDKGILGLRRRGSDPGSVIEEARTASRHRNKKGFGRLERSSSERRLVTKHGSSISSGSN